MRLWACATSVGFYLNQLPVLYHEYQPLAPSFFQPGLTQNKSTWLVEEFAGDAARRRGLRLRQEEVCHLCGSKQAKGQEMNRWMRGVLLGPCFHIQTALKIQLAEDSAQVSIQQLDSEVFHSQNCNGLVPVTQHF